MEENTIFEEHTVESSNLYDFLVSPWIRFANFIIDRIAFFIFVLILGALSGIMGMVEFWEDLAANRLYDILFSLALYVFFMFLQEAIFKTSLGKVITGCKLISTKGVPLTAGQILVRSFCRAIPFEQFSFLGKNSGWHDSFSNTLVVKKSYPTDFTSEFYH